MITPKVDICRQFAGNNSVILFEGIVFGDSFGMFETREEALFWAPILYKSQLKKDISEREVNASDKWCKANRSRDFRSKSIHSARLGMLNYFIDKYFSIEEWLSTEAKQTRM